jgi:hypothetical protein
MFFFEWLLTIYSKVLNQDVASRVWDLYFLEGSEILFKTGLSILRLLYSSLIVEDLGGIMGQFGRIADTINDGDVLVREIYAIEIPTWMRSELNRLVN